MKYFLLRITLYLIASTIFNYGYAQSVTIDKINYTLDSTKEYAILKSASSVSGDVTVPDKVTFTFSEKNKNTGEYETKKITVLVKEISNNAFYGNKDIISITANYIETIGIGAYSGCISLTKVAVGNSLKKIEQQAFFNCTSLKSINLPNGLKSIGYRAFYGCSQLYNASTLKIPASVTEFTVSTGENKSEAFRNSGVTK